MKSTDLFSTEINRRQVVVKCTKKRKTVWTKNGWQSGNQKKLWMNTNKRTCEAEPKIVWTHLDSIIQSRFNLKRLGRKESLNIRNDGNRKWRSNDLEQLKYCQQGLLPKMSEAPKKLPKKSAGKKCYNFGKSLTLSYLLSRWRSCSFWRWRSSKLFLKEDRILISTESAVCKMI